MLTEYELEVGWTNRAEVGDLLQCEELGDPKYDGPDSPVDRLAVILRNCVYELGAISVTGPTDDDWWVYPLIGMAKFYGCRFELDVDVEDTYTVTVAAGDDPLDPNTEWVAPDKELFDSLATWVNTPHEGGQAKAVLAHFGFIAD